MARVCREGAVFAPRLGPGSSPARSAAQCGRSCSKVLHSRDTPDEGLLFPAHHWTLVFSVLQSKLGQPLTGTGCAVHITKPR